VEKKGVREISGTAFFLWSRSPWAYLLFVVVCWLLSMYIV
jgi:hypothetical protein